MSSTLQYDTLNRLTNLGANANGAPVASYSYTLGASGNRTGVTELGGRQVTYAYDNLYRLTSETIANDASGLNGTVGYVYDAVGNRKQMNSTLAARPAGLWNYDANDRFTGFAAPSYDNDGNITWQAGTQETYDYENHLVGSGGITYVYDGDGNRVAKTIGGVTTNYLVDALNPTGYAQVLDELQGSTVARSYTWGLQLISESQLTNATPPASTWTTSYYGFDGHGSVRYLTDSTGAVSDTYDFDAFGNLINSAGNTPNNYLYSGEQYDPDLGLYYNRARYLDVRSGRFWGMDAWEGDPATPMSLHRYLYVYDDPALLVDESGNTPLSDFVSQLNGYLARLGGNAGKYTARGIGSLAHYAIEADVLLYYGLSHVVLPEQVLPGIGRVDLIVDLGIYEIKPLGGTVGPGPQLNRYLSGRPGFALGTIPFDDNVNKLILAAYLLPPWVNLHYELTSPGVIQYNFSFDTRILLPVLVYAVVRVGIAAINYQVQMDAATALMPI